LAAAIDARLQTERPVIVEEGVLLLDFFGQQRIASRRFIQIRISSRVYSKIPYRV
jgi:hypothetical protein